MKVTGEFTVKLNPIPGYTPGSNGVSLNRMSLDKEFLGDLEGKSTGEMLSAMTATKGSAGYVAIEQFKGSLQGKSGSFVLQHFGIMERGQDRLVLEVIPDSGTDELSGIQGKMNIRIENGVHYYDFEFSIP